MVYNLILPIKNTLSTLSTNVITNEGILDLFKNASWENLLFFVLFSAVIVFGVNRLTKPQKEQNGILKDFAKSIGDLVRNNAVEERSRDERHERYLSEIQDVRDRINRGFDSTNSELKELNNNLIKHTATRCYNQNTSQIREVGTNEEDKEQI
jgi:hypothetical protein